MSSEPIRLAVLVTHPVQYFAPVFRALSAMEGIDLRVYFGCPHGLGGEIDPFFKTAVAWDSAPTAGFDHEFVSDGPLSDLAGKPAMSLAWRAASRISAWRPRAVLVFSYSPRFITLATLMLAARGLPLLLRAETTDRDHDRSGAKDAVRDAALRAYYRLFRHVFPIGTNSRDHYLRLGVAPERMTEARYAIDVDFFQAQVRRWNPRRAELRVEVGIAPGDKALLFCGKLHPPKDPLLLSEALSLLPAEAAARTWLVVVGEGDLRPDLEVRSKAILGERAVFVGFKNQSELGRYYALCDALVLPSITGETWGLVVNEALQFGLHTLVSSRVGCALDLVRDRMTGAVFPAGDAVALARTIAELPGLPPMPCLEFPLPRPTDLARAVAVQVARIAGNEARP